MSLPRATLLLGTFLLACGGRQRNPDPAMFAPTASDSGFTVRTLGRGVYAVMRNEPLGLINESNSLFIVGDDDVIVVDAQSSRARALETLAALRRITSKPVSALINTHWHDDHVVGNEVYKEAFPALSIFGHVHNAEDMVTTGVRFRQAGAKGRAGTIAYLQGLVEKQQSFLGGPIDAMESRSHALSAALLSDYSNSADFLPLTPTRTVADTVVLRQGERRIEVRHLGRGHTRGDLVVYLPRERILATGDLLMAPIQFVGSTSYPREYTVTLERLRSLQPALVVPGHGPVMTGAQADRHADVVVRTVRYIVEQAEAAVARKETLAQAKPKIDLEAFRTEMAGDSRLNTVLFNYYIAQEGVARAFELAAERRSSAEAPRRLARAIVVRR